MSRGSSTVSHAAEPLKKYQIVCYGLGDLASQFVWTFVGSYLTIFYTDIVGFAPVIISVLMMAARIWDAVNDPMMGAIAERTKTKWGRFRPWIAFGSPFLAIFGILTFTAPFGNGTAGVVWAYITYIGAGMLYTLVNIPYSALAGVMTTDSAERNQLNGWRSAGMFAGMIIVNFCSSILMLRFSNGADVANGRGYLLTAVIYSVVAVPLFLLVFRTSREVVKPAASARISIKDSFRGLVTNKYLMLISLIMVFEMTGYMGRIAVTAYYVIYDMGSFALIGIIMSIPSIVGVPCALISPYIVKKIGKAKTLTAGMLIQGIGLIIVYFCPFTNVPMIIVGHIIFGLGGVATPVMLSMVADSVDYQDFKTGIRNDGTAYATYGLASKLGNAIGGAVGVLALSTVGYVANQQQTPAAMHGINVVVNLAPAVIFFIGAVISLFWKLSDKDADDARAKLKERSAQGTVESLS